jgi:branched-chain amino acid transport system permease protein
MSCVQQNEEAAMLQGMDPSTASYMAMALAGALAGVCGALAAPLFSLNSMMGLTPLLRALVVMSIAGVGSIPGVLVVGLSLGLVESVIATFDATLANIATFAALVVMLVVKPTGFWGRHV